MTHQNDTGHPGKNPLLTVSAPCRIDVGGTLDIPTFYYPLHRSKPCTFNVAVGLRTYVRFYPFESGKIKISSHGFDPIEFKPEAAIFHHPLGLMSAIAVYFEAKGLHIDIHSESPPRSALGGSSSAAVAMVAGLMQLRETTDGRTISSERIACLAHALESSVAGVPCGMQDQLAAVYGGVNAWYWQTEPNKLPFRRQPLAIPAGEENFQQHVLLAYCGEPHVSADINGQWVRQFLAGRYHREWGQMVEGVQRFVNAMAAGDFRTAVTMMNEETRIRRKMTPDVFDEMGEQLVDSALEQHCGVRFAGAGGGGCVWALGEEDAILTLSSLWKTLLNQKNDARLLDFSIDSDGLVCHV
jgi:D-glycero-alpha-D-manno-heptose-7-phosphate kinase